MTNVYLNDEYLFEQRIRIERRMSMTNIYLNDEYVFEKRILIWTVDTILER